jgi:hypothetical protein
MTMAVAAIILADVSQQVSINFSTGELDYEVLWIPYARYQATESVHASLVEMAGSSGDQWASCYSCSGCYAIFLQNEWKLQFISAWWKRNPGFARKLHSYLLSCARGQAQYDPSAEWVFSLGYYHITDDNAAEVDERAIRESNHAELLK